MRPIAREIDQIFPKIFELFMLPGITSLVIGNAKYLFFEEAIECFWFIDIELAFFLKESSLAEVFHNFIAKVVDVLCPRSGNPSG